MWERRERREGRKNKVKKNKRQDGEALSLSRRSFCQFCNRKGLSTLPIATALVYIYQRHDTSCPSEVSVVFMALIHGSWIPVGRGLRNYFKQTSSRSRMCRASAGPRSIGKRRSNETVTLIGVGLFERMIIVAVTREPKIAVWDFCASGGRCYPPWL